MDGPIQWSQDRPTSPADHETADLDDRGGHWDGDTTGVGAGGTTGVAAGVGVGFGFDFGVGVGAGVGVGVGGGALGGCDGSTDGLVEGTSEGIAVGHGRATGSEPDGDGKANEGTTPFASGVGAMKHDGDGAGAHVPLTSAPHDDPYGWNWGL